MGVRSMIMVLESAVESARGKEFVDSCSLSNSKALTPGGKVLEVSGSRFPVYNPGSRTYRYVSKEQTFRMFKNTKIQQKERL